MEDYKITGIVLNSIDINENDKLVTIFSLEFGKVKAKLKGVKSSKAKLKYAGQPFCFAEFVLQKTGEFFIVTSVNLIDSFYDLTSDYDIFCNASIMLKISNFVLKPAIVSEEYFLVLIKCLKFIAYDNLNYKQVLLKFFFKTLEFCGLNQSTSGCSNCGKTIYNNCYLSLKNGSVLCDDCSNLNLDVLLTKQEVGFVSLITNCNIDKLASIKTPENVLTNLFSYYSKVIEASIEISLR